MNKLLNLYHLQLKYDRLNELKREDRQIKYGFSNVEESTKRKFLQWKKAQESLQTLQSLLKEKENHMEDLEYKEQEYSKAMFLGEASKNPKLLSDLQKKVTILKENISNIESEMIEIMDQIDTGQVNFHVLDTEFQRLKMDFQKEKAFTSARTQEIVSEISALEKDILQSRKSIPEDLIDEFDNSFSRGQQMAVVYIQDNHCSGCGTTLSQRLIDSILKNPDQIYYCENCNRIIVRKND
jgi:predicted  nucleic acid-binding Zn-ribbon protein